MSDFFISYARRDAVFIRRLYDAFVAAGYPKDDIWVDWEDIQAGEEWWKEIEAGIISKSSFVFIISPESVRSDVCRNEVEFAASQNKRIIPILYRELTDPADRAQIHPKISAHNWISWREGIDDFDKAFATLRDTLNSDFGYIRMHTRLLVRAKEWETANRNPGFLLKGKELVDAETWLATRGTKEPEPTDLQTQHIYASRRAETNRQRRFLAGVTATLVISIVLTIVSFALWQIASSARDDSERNAQIAQANAEEARRNANVAESLRLANEARQLDHTNQIAALSLAMQAVEIADAPPQAQLALAEIAYRPGPKLLLEGHEAAVRTVAISPDGTRAVSGADDGVLILWDLETGEPLHTYHGHEGGILSVDFSDKFFVSGSRDGTVRVWSPTSDEPLHTLSLHTGAVRVVAFDPTGQKGLSGGEDHTIFVWDVSTGEIIQKYDAHPAGISAAAFDPTGTRVLSSSDIGELIQWAVDSPVRDFVWLPFNSGESGSAINKITYSRDNRYVITASADHRLALWDATRPGQLVYTFSGHNGPVLSAAFTNSEPNLAVSGAADHTLIIWDVLGDKALHTLVGHSSRVNDVDVTPDGSAALSASSDGTLILWDLSTSSGRQQLIRAFENPAIAARTSHDGRVQDVAFSPDGERVVSASSDDKLIIWNVNTGRKSVELNGHTWDVNAAAFSPDGTKVLSGALNGEILLWDATTGEALPVTFEGHTASVTSVAFIDDQTAISGSWDRTLIVWDVTTGEVLKFLRDHTSQVRDVAVNVEKKLALSGSFDGQLLLWNIDRTSEDFGTRLATFIGHSTAINSVVFNADGSKALSGSSDGTLVLWNVDKRSREKSFGEGTNWIYSVALSQDGSIALAGSADSTVSVWDVATGERLRTFTGHERAVTGLAFSPSESIAVSGSFDRNVMVWKIETLDDLIAWTEANRFIQNETISAPTGIAFSETAAQAKVTLVIESWRPDDEVVWQNVIIPAFMRDHPNIEVIFNAVDPENYNGIIERKLDAGFAGDIITCRAFDVSLNQFTAGHLLPLNDLPGIENFDADALAGWSTDDGETHYCVPIASVIHGFLYNADIFEELGLTEPRTEAEFFELLKKIKENGRYQVLALGTHDMWEAAYMGLQNIGPSYWKGEDGRNQLVSHTARYDEAGFLKAFEVLKLWQPYLPPSYQTLVYPEAQLLFMSGEAAIYPAGSWDIGFFKDRIGFELGAFKPPLATADAKCYINDHPDMGLGINAASPKANIEAARLFLSWTTTEEFANLYANSLNGFYPLSDHRIQIGNPVAQEFQTWRSECDRTFRTAYQWFGRGAWPVGESHDNDLWQASANVLNGTQTPAEAAQMVQERLEKYFPGVPQLGTSMPDDEDGS